MHLSPSLVKYVADPLERAARTFVQQFVVILMAGGSASLLLHQNWLVAVDSAAFAAAISILTSVSTFKFTVKLPVVDLALRVVKTFIQSFGGTLLAANVASVTHADWKGALAVAIPVSLTALLTGLAALSVPGTLGASFLPTSLTTPAAPSLDSLSVSDVPNATRSDVVDTPVTPIVATPVDAAPVEAPATAPVVVDTPAAPVVPDVINVQPT
jgi:hypothetical protein